MTAEVHSTAGDNVMVDVMEGAETTVKIEEGDGDEKLKMRVVVYDIVGYYRK